MPVILFKPSDNDNGGSGHAAAAAAAAIAQRAEDLHYRIELWDETGTVFERVLGVLSDGTIAYAAFYAAANAYPSGVIILSQKGRVLIQWNRSRGS
jgi:hypothetical protein